MTTQESFSASDISGSENKVTRGLLALPVTLTPALTSILGRNATMSMAGLAYGPLKRTVPLSTSSDWPQAR